MSSADEIEYKGLIFYAESPDAKSLLLLVLYSSFLIVHLD